MKYKIYIFIFYLIFLRCETGTSTPVVPSGSLTGIITDERSGDRLVGVNVYFPDLKTGTITDANGHYYIDDLPASRVLVQISFIGYKSLVKKIDLMQDSVFNAALEPAVTEMNEVVVTGNSVATEMKRTPAPVEIVPKKELLQQASSNIIDALASQPGISEITTGAGISKPVIRGLGYNRVVVVNNGVRQEGQQWGDEHGIEIDGYAVDRVEILKGPASLSYGSDALAGVINLLPPRPLPEGQIKGSVMTEYQTNNGLAAYSGDLAGNRNGFIWNLRFSNKLAHAYHNKYDGYVFNSGFRENALNAMAGFNKAWGYSHLTLSMYNMTPGIIEGERDSLTGNFVMQIPVNDTTVKDVPATNHQYFSYSSVVPYQKIHHYKAVLNNNILLGSGELKTIFGYQQNQRQEFGNAAAPKSYDLYLLLNTLTYDARYQATVWKNTDVSFGINGMHQQSSNQGDEFLVPDYRLFDAGVFVIGKKSMGNLDVSGGFRFDSRHITGNSLFLSQDGKVLSGSENGGITRFAGFNSVFTGFSGSLGATWQFNEKLFSKINISQGFRAPNIAELGVNGVHEGTQRYEIGDPELKPEVSRQLDLSTGYRSEHISAEADLFVNNINHYIFSHKLNAASGKDSITEGYETFKYSAGKAVLTGGEFSIDIHPHPLDWLHFKNDFSVVNAVQTGQPDSMKYLPFIPAPRIQSEIRANIKNAGTFFQNAFISAGVNYHFAKNNVYTAFGTETTTPAYLLFNAGIGADVVIHNKKICSFYILGKNITDKAYQNHLSRLKYAGINYLTDRRGVYNMGRTIDFKLIFPLSFHTDSI
ncbi:MAG TPA: TonB-dependent receptor [Bacteroidales bacterium]|nr:TonB-dependent receptor [Bacteroidales bacterium]